MPRTVGSVTLAGAVSGSLEVALGELALAQRDVTVDGVEATQFYATCNFPLLMIR